MTSSQLVCRSDLLLGLVSPDMVYVLTGPGGSAYAAGELVKRMGGDLMGFIFIMELEFLKGRDKLPAPVFTLLSGQEGKP